MNKKRCDAHAHNTHTYKTDNIRKDLTYTQTHAQTCTYTKF